MTAPFPAKDQTFGNAALSKRKRCDTRNILRDHTTALVLTHFEKVRETFSE